MSAVTNMHAGLARGVAAPAASRKSTAVVASIGSSSSAFAGNCISTPSVRFASVAERGSLKVEAKKGKGRNAGNRGAGPGGRGGGMPNLPPMDPDNPNFMLFVRSAKVKQWYPLSVVQGGSQAKVLMQGMDGWAKGMASATLTRNVGQVIYKDEEQVRSSVYKMHPVLKQAKELEYGYKLVDPANPMKSMTTVNDVELIPPEDDLKTPVDGIRDTVSNLFGGKK